MKWKKFSVPITKNIRVKAGDFVKLISIPDAINKDWRLNNFGKIFEVINGEYDQITVKVPLQYFEYKDEINEEEEEQGYIECGADITDFELVSK